MRAPLPAPEPRGPDALDPPPFEQLPVALSWRCDFACRHCCISATPEAAADEMTAAELSEWLPAVARQFRLVCFTGGEPTLAWDRLLAGIRACTAVGVPATMVSHGKWLDGDGANERMDLLAGAGLTFLTLSYDEYHDPFWPKARLLDAVGRAAAHGFSVWVKLVRGTRFSEGWADEFRAAGAVWAGVQDLYEVGRARLVKLRGTRVEPLSSCPSLASPMLAPNGDLFACCNAETLRATHLLGNAREHPIAELLARRRTNPLLTAEMALGPGGLAEILGLKDGSDNLCRLCAEIMRSPARVARLHEALGRSDLRRQIVGRNLLFACQEYDVPALPLRRKEG